MERVFYNLGNNIENEYFIVAKKEKFTINKDSLIEKITNDCKIEIIDTTIAGKRYTSSKDFLIKEVNKLNNSERYFFCDNNELQLLNNN